MPTMYCVYVSVCTCKAVDLVLRLVNFRLGTRSRSRRHERSAARGARARGNIRLQTKPEFTLVNASAEFANEVSMYTLCIGLLIPSYE